MKLLIQSREITGKKVAGLRKEGLVPAVVYGKHFDNSENVSVNKVQFLKTFAETGTSTPIELHGEGMADHLVLVHDMQLHPVSDHLIHVDFLAVNKDEKVTAEVSLIMTGESPYEKSGEGSVQLLKKSIMVEALPMDLPHDAVIDVSGLDHDGQVLFVKDLDLGDKVLILDDSEQAIVSTTAFKVDAADEETVEGEESEAAPAE